MVQQPSHEQPMNASWLHVPKAPTFEHVEFRHGLRQGSLPGSSAGRGLAGGLGGGTPLVNDPEAAQN